MLKRMSGRPRSLDDAAAHFARCGRAHRWMLREETLSRQSAPIRADASFTLFVIPAIHFLADHREIGTRSLERIRFLRDLIEGTSTWASI
jgi:hypothetical protein